MESNILIFESPSFGQLRGVNIEDNAWLIGADVAKRLGYSNPHKALRDHVDDDDRMTERIVHPSRGSQQTILINESGLYSLILSSKLPQAREFKRWVTSEVLPQIRRTGRYELTSAELRQLGERADYCDQVLRSVSCLTTTQVAKEMSMTGTELYRWLIVLGIIYWQSGQYMLYANFAREGLAKSRTRYRYTPTGDIRTETYLVWTEKGRKYLHELFERPESDFARFRDFENASTLLN